MDSPNEFAAVLAHEMAHESERHPTVSFLRSLGISAVISIITGGSDILETIGEAGGLLAMLSYSRSFERDADRIAFDLLERQQIDPRGLATLFTKMSAKSKKKKAEAKAKKPDDEEKFNLFDYLNTHPGTDDRIAQAEAEFHTLGYSKEALTPAEWQAIKNVCR